MRTADEWFDLYGESHKHPTNKRIHWICVPLILLSALGLLQALPHPFPEPLNWGAIAGLASLVFYATLSWSLAAGMGVVMATCLLINAGIQAAGLSLGITSGVTFAVAWGVQFVGHEIEGKKPSFFRDFQFLLVGPAWLLHFVFQKLGIQVGPGAAG